MSRSKKSRKPSAFDINPIVTERKKTTPDPRKPKKKKGKPAGNRQQEAQQQKTTKGQGSHGKADPRVGSKKPIDLLAGQVTKAVTQPQKPKAPKRKASDSAIANIRVVEADDALQQELYAIEEDAKLQQILAKQDEDVLLTEAEIDYFNEKMERHQELSALLGLAEDDEHAQASESRETGESDSNDEDALWDKLDNSDLSRFE